MPNTTTKHAANFYLSRDLTDRIKAIAETMNISGSSIVAMCLDAGLPTLERTPDELAKDIEAILCQE
jgi:hypothetical protein